MFPALAVPAAPCQDMNTKAAGNGQNGYANAVRSKRSHDYPFLTGSGLFTDYPDDLPFSREMFTVITLF